MSATQLPEPALPQFETAREYLNVGSHFLHHGNPRLAIRYLEEAIRRNEINYNAQISFLALYFKGRAYLDLRQFLPAFNSLDTALQLNPRSGAAHYWMGVALRFHGQIPDAIESFYEALRCNPQFFPERNALDEIEAEQNAVAPPAPALQM